MVANPDLTGEDLVDWEAFQETETRKGENEFLSTPTQLRQSTEGDLPDLFESVKSQEVDQASFEALLNQGGVITAVDNVSGEGLDGSQKEIRNTRFSGVDLKESRFSNSTLHNTAIVQSFLEGADFFRSRIDSSRFKKTHLSESTFNGAEIVFSHLLDVVAIGTNFEGVIWQGTEIHNTNAAKSDFRQGNFRQLLIRASDLSRGNFEGSSFVGVRVDDTSFTKANFKDAVVDGVFHGANFQGADFTGAEIRGEFKNSDFRGAKGLSPKTVRFLKDSGAVVGPISTTPNIKTTPSIPEFLVGLTEDVSRVFGLNLNIVLASIEDIREGRTIEGASDFINQYIQNDTSLTWDGSYIKIGDTAIISINDVTQDTETKGPASIAILETYSHELGHLVEKELRRDPIHNAGFLELERVHQEHLRELEQLTVKEFFFRYRTPESALRTYKRQLSIARAAGVSTRDFQNQTMKEWSQTAYGRGMTDYMLSFEEWFGDQFAKWLATEPAKKDIKSKVGRYMQELATRLKRLYELLFKRGAINPNREFADWVNNVVFQTREDLDSYQEQFGREPVVPTPLRSTTAIIPPPPPDVPGPPRPTDPGSEGDPFRGPSFTINPDDLNEGMKGKAWRTFIKWLAPRGRLDQGSFEIAKRELAFSRKEVREAFSRIREVQDYIKENYPDGRLTPELERKMDLVLRGKKNEVTSLLRAEEARRNLPDDPNTLPAELTRILLDARRHIDRLSTTLLQEGVIEGRLAERVASNVGTYLHRQYRVHLDPEWAKNVPQDVMNRAKAFIRNRLQAGRDRPVTPREVDIAIELLLTNNEVQQGLLLNDKLKARQLSILRSRKGVPKEIRALWGEIESPLYNYYESVRKIADLLSFQRGSKEIREAGKGIYFFPPEELFAPSGYTAEIQAGVEDPLHPLAGWRTHPEILESLRTAFGESDYPSGWFHQLFLKVNGLVKIGKVPYNPMTVSRNFWGGTMFLHGEWA